MVDYWVKGTEDNEGRERFISEMRKRYNEAFDDEDNDDRKDGMITYKFKIGKIQFDNPLDDEIFLSICPNISCDNKNSAHKSLLEKVLATDFVLQEIK